MERGLSFALIATSSTLTLAKPERTNSIAASLPKQRARSSAWSISNIAMDMRDARHQQDGVVLKSTAVATQTSSRTGAVRSISQPL